MIFVEYLEFYERVRVGHSIFMWHQSLFYFPNYPKSTHPGIKSLWSSSVESISEYCRIVWDIFSLERSILFLVGDPSTRVPRFLNTWEQQGMEKFMAQFSGIGAAAPGTGELTSSMQIKCLEMAINKLTEQRERDKVHRQVTGFLGTFFRFCIIAPLWSKFQSLS